MNKVNRVIKVGTTLYKFINLNVKDVSLPCVSYHIIKTDVPLFFTQNYHNMNGGYSEVYDSQVRMYLTYNQIHIHIGRKKTNISIVYNSFMSENEKRLIGPQMRSSLYCTKLSKLDLYT